MSSSGTIAEVPPVASSTYRVKFLRDRDPRYYPALFVGFLSLAAVFAVWRTVVADWGIWFGPVAWFADMFGIATSVLFVGIMRSSHRPAPRHVTDVTRTVDILIPTANEPLSVLEPTVIGARGVRGVRDVLVLDDGSRDEVRDMAGRLGVRYLRRPGRDGAKAGNLNHGLRYTDAELVVTFDADHIPMPEFLERTVGYFDDPTVGFVQTPQEFYNTESMTFRKRRGSAVGWHEQEMFYGGVQPAKNGSNSAFFTGTGAVLRRSAIDSIGGFAEGTATEDIHTSIRLHSRGWRSVYLPVPLAYGLEVDNLREFYRTRRRWAAGSLGLLFRSPDSPLRISGLSLRQRLNYVSSMAAHLQGSHRVMYMLTPVLAIMTGRSPVQGSYALFGGLFAAFTVTSLWVTTRYGRGHFHPLHSEVFTVAASIPMFAGLRGLLRVERTFEVTQKRAGRDGGRALKVVYWALAFGCLVGFARAVELVLRGQHTVPAGWAAAVFGVNLVVLVTFLVAIARYERRRGAPAYANLTAQDLYGYVSTKAGAA